VLPGLSKQLELCPTLARVLVVTVPPLNCVRAASAFQRLQPDPYFPDAVHHCGERPRRVSVISRVKANVARCGALGGHHRRSHGDLESTDVAERFQMDWFREFFDSTTAPAADERDHRDGAILARRQEA